MRWVLETISMSNQPYLYSYDEYAEEFSADDDIVSAEKKEEERNKE